MQFIRPRNRRKATFMLSQHSLDIVKYYAEYTGRTEDDIVDQFLKNVMHDPDFIAWIKNKRHNKRMLEKLRVDVNEGDAKHGQKRTFV